MADEVYYIAKCRELIEKKLAWGKSDIWQTQDFENLSEKIFEETKVMLSNSTLKRIWGKVRYESIPNMTTLNALAQFAGYENWRAFTATDFQSLNEKKDSTAKSTFQLPFKIFLPVAGFVLIIALIAFGLVKKQSKPLNFKNVQFTSKPVTSGLPNTVIFQYDASNSNADSVFIQQSWDSKKRYKVDKQLHEYTSTYYYPGYYRAKLILNDSIVKERDVYIETDGWVGIIERNPIPIYLPKSLFKKQLGLTQGDLSKLKIDVQKEPPVFTLIKVSKDLNLMSDNFSLQVQLQNTYNESNAICQYTHVVIFGTKGIISIPLCKVGCVGEIGLMLGMNYINGKTNNLSSFGVDFSKDVKLTCETKNQFIKLSVNDKVAYTGDFKQNIGTLVGMQVEFNGVGTVKYFEVKKNK